MASYTPLSLPEQFDHLDYVPERQITNTFADVSPEIEVICGPLLNYKRLDNADSEAPTWNGSVLIVAKTGQDEPVLWLKKSGRGVLANSQTSGEVSTNGSSGPGRSFEGVKLYSDPEKTFWAFPIDLPLAPTETRWQYIIPNVRYVSQDVARPKPTQSFVVPAATQSMRIMFHSCNGFSVGTDEEAYSGPALWNDVLRMHRKKPFHVMIGGGDQIYNDGVRVDGPLKEWTAIKNPHKRREYPFNESLRVACDGYYFNNYVQWYSSEPFASANGEIPQINIWDDHGECNGRGL